MLKLACVFLALTACDAFYDGVDTSPEDGDVLKMDNYGELMDADSIEQCKKCVVCKVPVRCRHSGRRCCLKGHLCVKTFYCRVAMAENVDESDTVPPEITVDVDQVIPHEEESISSEVEDLPICKWCFKRCDVCLYSVKCRSRKGTCCLAGRRCILDMVSEETNKRYRCSRYCRSCDKWARKCSPKRKCCIRGGVGCRSYYCNGENVDESDTVPEITVDLDQVIPHENMASEETNKRYRCSRYCRSCEKWVRKCSPKRKCCIRGGVGCRAYYCNV